MPKWMKVGCLTIVLVVSIGSVVVMKNFRSLSANAVEKVIVQTIEQLELPEESNAEARSAIRDLSIAYKEGDVGPADLKDFAQRVSENPMLTYGVAVYAMLQDGFKDTDLTDAERDRAIRACQRFLSGVEANAFSNSEYAHAFDALEEGDGSSFRTGLSKSEVLQFVETLEETADRHNVPAGTTLPNFGAEIREEVERAIRP